MQVFKPKDIAQAYEARCKDSRAIYLSGGSEVLRKDGLSARDSILLDIKDILPSAIGEKGGLLSIGGGATFQAIAESPIAPAWLKEACRFMASLSLRMQATVAGQIATLSESSYLIPALLAAKTRIVVYGENGESELLLEDYVRKGSCDCIILSILIPSGARVAVKRIARTSHSHSAVNVAVNAEGGVYAAVRSSGLAFSLDELKTMEMRDDITGSAAYKRFIALECADILAKEVES